MKSNVVPLRSKRPLTQREKDALYAEAFALLDHAQRLLERAGARLRLRQRRQHLQPISTAERRLPDDFEVTHKFR